MKSHLIHSDHSEFKLAIDPISGEESEMLVAGKRFSADPVKVARPSEALLK